jgi:hypothetical protein
MEIAMKQHDITKHCADSLRSLVNDNHDIKLGSSHAHEIVAAFFGYKSRAALLADTKYPLSNLEQAEFILLTSCLPFVDERIKKLDGLPSSLPPSHILAQGIYPVILAQKGAVEKLWPSFYDLAIHIVEQRLHEWARMWQMISIPKRDMIVDIQRREDNVVLTVDVGYHTEQKERLRDKKFVVTLPYVAANVGYGGARVEEIQYSGMARKWSDEEILKKYPTPLGIAAKV